METSNLARKFFYYNIHKKLKKIEIDYIKKFTNIVSVAKHETNRNFKIQEKVVARPEVLLGAGLEYVVPNATEPEDFAKKCIDALEGRINYKVVWERFNEMNV